MLGRNGTSEAASAAIGGNMDNSFVTQVRQRAMQTKVNRGGLTKGEAAELAKWAVAQAGSGKDAEIRKALTIMGVSAASITDVLSKSKTQSKADSYVLTEATQRKQLVQATPQRNPVSKRAGMGHEVCGGAAVASALVLSSNSKAKARANARAIRAVLGSHLTDEENKALKKFEEGTMATRHLALLQLNLFLHVNYKVDGAQKSGLSPKAVGTLVKSLKENGGFAGDTVVVFKRQDHWTIRVNGTFIDTDASPTRARVSSSSPHRRSEYGDHVETQSGKRTTIKAHERGNRTPTWYDVNPDSSSDSGYSLRRAR
jgi:hypothetical protein